MHDAEKYIGMLEHEISKLIEKESKGFTEKGEIMLYALLHNYKHAKKFIEEKHGTMNNPGMDNPRKSYFGGV